MKGQPDGGGVTTQWSGWFAPGQGRYPFEPREDASVGDGRLRAIVLGSPIPTVITRYPGGEFLCANEQAIRMFGLPADLNPDTPKASAFYADPEDRARLVGMLSDGGRIEGLELRLRRLDGVECWALMSLTLIEFMDGPAIHAALVDVTRQREAHNAIVRAKDEAEAANRAKTEFLAVLSHEVRTPMNGVLALAQLLAETPLDAERRGWVETIRHSAESVLVILNDALDISRIETGGIALERTEFDLAHLVQGVVTLMSARARAKGLDIGGHLLPGTPLRVRGDPHRLRQVLINLIGNAVKFTDRGRVSVEVEAIARQRDARRLRFAVTDTGRGVPEPLRGRIFDPFVHLEPSPGPNDEGSGLGLAVCRRLVRALGGEIGLESEVGRGSTFWFTVDMEGVASPEAEAHAADFEMTPSLDILVVDDVDLNLKVARGILERDGHRVTTVSGGGLALEAIQAGDFDLVLLDLRMPDMDGYEVLRRIRALPDARKAAPPVLAMTAALMAEERQRVIAEGFEGLVPKPVDIALLRRALAQVARDAGRLDAAALAAAGEEGERFEPAYLDDLESLLGHGETRDLTRQFRDSLDDRLEGVARARLERDAVRLSEAAHKLAGTAGSCGLMRLQALACAAEDAARAGDEARIDPAVGAVMAEAPAALAELDRWIGARRDTAA